MVIDWKWIFRKVAKILAYATLVITALYLVFNLVTSLVFRPYNVKVTNVTSTSASVSWITNFPMTGVVTYKEKDSFLPLFLSSIGANRGYDDRDFAYAQEKCVEDFNEEAKRSLSADFSVDGSNYDCDNVKISRVGRYYVHHVTIKGLDEKKSYSFKVGDRVWGWKGEKEKFATTETPANIKEPMPIFGRVSSDGKYTNDSIVYTTFVDASDRSNSMVYSSVTNSDGGWYLDGGNTLDADGKQVDLKSGQDLIVAQAIYKNRGFSDSYVWVYGNFDGAYPDIELKESDGPSASRGQGVLGVGNFSVNSGTRPKPAESDIPREEIEEFLPKNGQDPADPATPVAPVEGGEEEGGCTYASIQNCSEAELTKPGVAADWGYGNVARALAALEPDGNLDAEVLEKIGLSGDAVTIAGNISAIVGTGVKAAEVERAMNTEGGVVAYNVNTGSYCVTGSAQYDSGCGTQGGGSGDDGDDSGQVSDADETGEVTVTVKMGSNGEETVDIRIGDVNIENWDFMEDKVNEIKSGCSEASISGDGCVFTIHAIEIDILALRRDNPDFAENCKNDPSCPKDAIIQALREKMVADEKILELEEELGMNPLLRLPEGYVPCLDLSSCPNFDLPEGFELNDLTLVQPPTGGYTPEMLNDYFDTIRLYPDGSEKEKALRFVLNQMTGGSLPAGYSVDYLLDPSTIFETGDNGQIIISNPTNPAVSKIEITLPAGDQRLAIPNNVAMAVTDVYMIDREIGESYYVSNVDSSLIEVIQSKNNARKAEGIAFAVASSPCGDGKCNNGEAKELLDKLLAAGVNIEGIYLVDGMDFGQADFVVPYGLQGPQLEGEITDTENLIEEFEAPSVQPDIFDPNEFNQLLPKVYAKDTVEGGSVLFLPEYGMFSLQLGNYELATEVSNDDTIYVFYIDTNGKDGFQAPKNPDNPTINEDIVIRSNSFKITLDQKATSRKYNLKKGINILSFDFIPVSSDGTTYTARDLVLNASKTGVNIEYISYFDGGRWIEGLKCTKESCVGSDFTILPGKGYLLKAAKTSAITVAAYNLKTPIPVNLSAGWNLVGIHGYPKTYTAKTFINSINTIEGLTADNVTWYPTSKGRYDGLQITENVEYGFDFPISPVNGYFVRIKKFEPKNQTCKSIIWHDGNELNGACGDSKTIF